MCGCLRPTWGQKLKFHELSPAFGSDDFQALGHHETKHQSITPVALFATTHKQLRAQALSLL
jgi:hypothetical protein